MHGEWERILRKDMAKLYFFYGTVGSAKTLNLLATAYKYESQKKRFILLKPKLDNRFGENKIRSRAGLEREADYIISSTENELPEDLGWENVDVVLVDEAQFLNRSMIDSLNNISKRFDVPVLCYGLRADFRTKLFEGSKRLFELSDIIREIKSVCQYCNNKAIQNLKHVDGKPTVKGPSIDLGAEEKYFPVCNSCYSKALRDK